MTKLKFRVRKSKICKHCGQLVMFDNCLVDLKYYDYFVCKECLRRLYTGCICCGESYLKKSPKLVKLEEKEGSESEFEEGSVCQRCIDEGYFQVCEDCGFLMRAEYVDFYCGVDKDLCIDCVDSGYSQCSYCDEYGGLYTWHEIMEYSSTPPPFFAVLYAKIESKLLQNREK